MSIYSKRNRRSRRARQAELAIMQALAAQELSAMQALHNSTAALDQAGLDEVTKQAFETTNHGKGLVR